MTWTPALDRIIQKTVRGGGSYVEAVRAVRRATRGRFVPHPSTIRRRLDALRSVSTRVDTTPAPAPREEIPGRVRAPLAERLAPPNVNVLSLPLEVCDAHPRGWQGAVDDALSSLPPGWSYAVVDPDETRSDAWACARHHAARRGDQVVLVEDVAGRPPVVALRRAGEQIARVLFLVVVRYAR